MLQHFYVTLGVLQRSGAGRDLCGCVCVVLHVCCEQMLDGSMAGCRVRKCGTAFMLFQ
jgi:hypothetical protein